MVAVEVSSHENGVVVRKGNYKNGEEPRAQRGEDKPKQKKVALKRLDRSSDPFKFMRKRISINEGKGVRIATVDGDASTSFPAQVCLCG